MRSTTIRRALALISFSIFSSGVLGQQCYYPDGSESDDTPCSGGDNLQVFCCPSGSRCVVNPGPLCQTSTGGYERGSCTVEDWASSACPKFCLATNENNRIDRCSNGGNFCCGYDADEERCDCNTNNNTFPLQRYTPIEVFAASTRAASTFSIPTESPSISESPSSSPTSADASEQATTNGPPGITNAAVADTGLSTVGKIGLGVAIPLAVIILAVAGFLIWRRKKKNSQAPSELPGQGTYPPPPNGAYQPPNGAYQDPKPHWQQQHQGAYVPPPQELHSPTKGPVPYGNGGPPPVVHEMDTQGR